MEYTIQTIIVGNATVVILVFLLSGVAAYVLDYRPARAAGQGDAKQRETIRSETVQSASGYEIIFKKLGAYVYIIGSLIALAVVQGLSLFS